MLADHLSRQTYAIAAGYVENRLEVAVVGVRLARRPFLELTFPKANPFSPGQLLTLHVDDRTGVEEFDPELRVHRSSVKARLVGAGLEASAEILEYELHHGSRVVEKYAHSSFSYADDKRPEAGLPASPLTGAPRFDDSEYQNKLGVLVTRGPAQPHTTVMAFLSSEYDDIFLITRPGTLKWKYLQRDRRVAFAIDHRANYLFEKAYEWNYTIFRGEAGVVPPGSEVFRAIQAAFIDKNPWEIVFFSAPDLVMYHIQPQEILCAEKYQRALRTRG